jgi:hypothetical protein
VNLPGLNFDAGVYPTCSNNDETFAIIPFSDWLPSDFEDVPCSRGCGYRLMYFSPSTGMMVPSESETAGEAVEPINLTTWLKKI